MRLPKPKIVISGASGLLGAGLQKALAARDRPVLRLVRRQPSTPQELQWNPSHAALFDHLGALEDAAAVIHLSGANIAAHRWTAAYKRELVASRVETTHALATALGELSRPPESMLVASAIGFYGDRGDEVLDERSSRGAGFMAELCDEWESATRPAIQAGIRVVHLRLGLVLGKGGALDRIKPIFRLGLGGRLGTGRQWMSWISLEDAVAAILFALETPALDGPLNLTAPHPLTNADFTRALACQLHRPAFMPAPAFALRLCLGQMADEALLASTRAVPARLTEAGFRFAYPQIDGALAAALQDHALS